MIKGEVLCRRGGIYKIENILNGDFYVGSSIDVYKRYYQHRTLLKRNKHYSTHLQHAWNRYGKENFVFTVLKYADLSIDELRKLEQEYLDKLKPVYNLSSEVYNLSVSPRPESHCKNISSALRSSPITQSKEFRERISNSVKELWKDPEYRRSQLIGKNSDSAKKNYSNSMKTRWSNREYKSRTLDSILGSFSLGKNKSSKFNITDILNIRELASSGVAIEEICSTYDSSYKTIKRIISKKTWNFV